MVTMVDYMVSIVFGYVWKSMEDVVLVPIAIYNATKYKSK